MWYNAPMMEILHPVLTQFFFMIIGAVLSIATLMLTLHYSLRKDMSALRTELKSDMEKMENEMQRNFSELRKEVSSLGQRVAKLEGVLLPIPKEISTQKNA